MSSPAEVDNKPDLSQKKTASPAEASNYGKKTPRSLKGKAKIVKKSPINNSWKNKGAGSSQVKGRKRNIFRSKNENQNKIVEDVKVLNSRKESQQGITNEEDTEKNHQAEKNPGQVENFEKSQRKQRSTEERHGSGKDVKSKKNSEKRDEKREKLGGLIFMCSGKTKPDCFHYRIMGVSMGKKDLVLGINPGLKLFLYDFDLKLLYGIYKASSSGGLKIEPKAFNGAFPAQVRFNVVKDCFPLPESVFKKAIKENYDEKHKFKTELTVPQVRKLTALFRPAQVHSAARTLRSPREALGRDRGVHEGERGSHPLSHRDARARDPYANDDARMYPVLAHERDQLVAYRDVASARGEEYRDVASARGEEYRDVASARGEETSHNLYLTEKEYRAYGLRGDRRNVSHLITPALEARPREFEREHLPREPNLIYRDAAYARDPHLSYHFGASSSDPYLAHRRREDAPLESYVAGGRREISNRTREAYDVVPERRETDHHRPVERLSLYSREAAAAAEAEFGYNPGRNYLAESKPEAFPAPVSSRYAFAGPPYSYR